MAPESSNAQGCHLQRTDDRACVAYISPSPFLLARFPACLPRTSSVSLLPSAAILLRFDLAPLLPPTPCSSARSCLLVAPLGDEQPAVLRIGLSVPPGRQQRSLVIYLLECEQTLRDQMLAPLVRLPI